MSDAPPALETPRAPGAGAVGQRRAVRLEAAAFALLAALPLLPYFVYLAQKGIPRFTIFGDYAGLELAIRSVPTGRVLLGPYSRFGFSHPGPLYFYLAAPVYALAGGATTGLFAAATAVNAAAAMTIGAATRVLTTRAHAVAAVVVVHAWLAAFGDVCVLPWNPLVVVLPLTCFLVLAAFVSRGWTVVAPLSVVFGVLVAETHLATVPTVLGASALAIASLWLRVRRAGGQTGAQRRHLRISEALLFLTTAPPLVEQVIAPEGNLGKIVKFFATQREPMKPFATALRDWVLATAWLPDRILSNAVPNDGWEPAVMGSGPMPLTITRTATSILVVFLAAATAAAFAAWRRRDDAGLALLQTGALSSALAVFALRAIIGVDYSYLVFWTTAATTTVWMAALAAATTYASEALVRARGALARAGAPLALALGAATGLYAASLQRAWLAHDVLRAQPYPRFGQVYEAVRSRVASKGETPVVHLDGAWHIGSTLLLELTRDGLAPRTVERDRWLSGRHVLGAGDAPHPLHLYAAVTPSHPHPFAACLEKLVEVDGVIVFTSGGDVERCAPPPPAPAPPATDR